MTDMTAEQIWRDVDGIERQIACNEIKAPAVFTLMKQLVQEALSAPSVPDGWRDFVAEVVESAEGYESRSGNKVNGDWVARGRVLLTAAQSPADYVCHKCGKKTSPPKPFKLYVSCENCGVTTAATIAKDLASSSPAEPRQDEHDRACELFNAAQGGLMVGRHNQAKEDESELAKLRERVKVLEGCIETIRTSLHKANDEGAISDTLWASDCETLFDYIEAARLREGGDQ